MSSLEQLQAEKQSILKDLKESIKNLANLQNEKQDSIACLNKLVLSVEALVSADHKVAEAIKDVVDKELKQAVFGVESLSADISNLQRAFDKAIQESFDPLLNNIKDITLENSSDLEILYNEASSRIKNIQSDITNSANKAQKEIHQKYNAFESQLTEKSSEFTTSLSTIEDRLESVVTQALSVADQLSENVNLISNSAVALQQKDSQFTKDMSALIQKIVREELQAQLSPAAYETQETSSKILTHMQKISEDLAELKNKKSGLLGGILK